MHCSGRQGLAEGTRIRARNSATGRCVQGNNEPGTIQAGHRQNGEMRGQKIQVDAESSDILLEWWHAIVRVSS